MYTNDKEEYQEQINNVASTNISSKSAVKYYNKYMKTKHLDKNGIDIKENLIYKLDNELMDILLQDRTTKKNIIWGSDNYADRGRGYQSDDEIKTKYITGRNGNIIKPRTKKTEFELMKRIKGKGEVFTPSWICNKQNNLIDNSWFGRSNVFNIEIENKWISNGNKIEFLKDKNWGDYIKEKRIEFACGEAPYLVSRYDTVTGYAIPVNERIGMLDRKFRIICENVNDKNEWMNWAKIAVKSIYGFEFQGDNVLLARENLLFTFQDYYVEKFNNSPSVKHMKEMAEIISWNIWQMDGLKYIVPNSCHNETIKEITLFGEESHIRICEGCKNGNPFMHNGAYCVIKDWESNREVKFVDLLRA